jgi:hypothetical protein
MKQNINIEAEGSELILRNKAGDYVIIPKKYRTEVQGMIKDGCHGCIDALVDTLPVMADYAPDGSLIPATPNSYLAPKPNKYATFNPSTSSSATTPQSYLAPTPKVIDVTLPKTKEQINQEALEEMAKKVREVGQKPVTTPIDNTRVANPDILDIENKTKIQQETAKNIQNDAIAVKSGLMNEGEFRQKWGTSLHRYNQETDINYAQQAEKNAKKTQSLYGKVDFPSTDFRSSDYQGNPALSFMNPNGLKGQALKDMEMLHMGVIGAALPIPMIDKMGKIPSVFDVAKNIKKGAVMVDDISKPVINAINKTDNIVNQADNIRPISNQLDEPPLEIVFDDMLPNRNSNINLNRGDNYTKTKKQIPYEKIDLGNDLTLYNNASRQLNDNSILGTRRAIKSIKNHKTNEYVDLKSWKDGDSIYYYFSANMPSSKIKAGKAYMELEKYIPKGSEILENSSLSMDSFNNILKQLKNPKFENSVKGKISLNNMSIHNKVPFADKQSMFASSDKVLFDTFDDASLCTNEINKILKTHNLPEASIVSESFKFQPQAHLPYENRTVYSIELPNIALKKLYTILGLTGSGAAIQSRTNKNDKNEL